MEKMETTMKVTIIEENYIDNGNLYQKTKLLLNDGTTYPLYEDIIYDFQQYNNLINSENSEIKKETTLADIIDNGYPRIEGALYKLGFTRTEIKNLIPTF